MDHLTHPASTCGGKAAEEMQSRFLLSVEEKEITGDTFAEWAPITTNISRAVYGTGLTLTDTLGLQSS